MTVDWNGTPEDEKRACFKYWLRLSSEQRQRWKQNYERSISIEKGTYDPGTYNGLAPKGKRLGDAKPYPDKMPWMLPHMERGLTWITELITRLENGEDQQQIMGCLIDPQPKQQLDLFQKTT